MNTFDFNRSFFTFRIDTLVKQPLTVTHKPPFSLNNARIPIECRCVVTEKATDQAQSFVLGASCKTERVGVESDIWLEPNADFCPIFSDDRYLSLKTYSQVGTTMELFPPGSGSQSDRQTGLIDETYDSVKIDMTECEGTPLDSAQEIVEAVLANQNLVARPELEHDRYRALIEHPVKTINANELPDRYGTGVVPRPVGRARCDADQPGTGLLGLQLSRLDRVHRSPGHSHHLGRQCLSLLRCGPLRFS